LEELQQKHGILNTPQIPIFEHGKWVKKPEILVESIGTLFSLIIFFKYKRKYKKVRRIENELRQSLLRIWIRSDLPLERRWKLLWQWILKASQTKEVKINNKKLDLLKPKYKLVWEDIVRRTGL
jgi:hypothetical protein